MLELSAVSAESWITLITKPTATTCMATSRGMPKSEQARGMSSRLPEGTPLAPQAARADTTQSTRALAKLASMPSVLAAARVSVVMVIAAPAMFTVAPTGMVTE